MAAEADLRKGKDVCEGLGVVPNCAKVLDDADQCGNLWATISGHFEWTGTLSDVGEKMFVVENTNCRLTVKENPSVWDGFMTGCWLDESEIIFVFGRGRGFAR
jgi:hypothetical protein